MNYARSMFVLIGSQRNNYFTVRWLHKAAFLCMRCLKSIREGLVFKKFCIQHTLIEHLFCARYRIRHYEFKPKTDKALTQNECMYTHVHKLYRTKWLLNSVALKERVSRSPSPFQPEKLHFHLFYRLVFFVAGGENKSCIARKHK